jgi:hypothetical protein
MHTCTLCVTRRLLSAAPDPPCTRAYEEVIVLLQAGRKPEALTRAVLIRCEHMRSEALKLVERSRHLARVVDAGDWGGLAQEAGANCCEPTAG